MIDEILRSTVGSFALYGFPESHAIGFAFLAYGSAYLKFIAHQFYASLLNNQPMGFYTPSTIVKDAQRHGVKILPVCVQASDRVAPSFPIDDPHLILGIGDQGEADAKRR